MSAEEVVRTSRPPKHLSDLDDQWLIETHFFGLSSFAKDGPYKGKKVLHNPKKRDEHIPPDVIMEAIDASVDALEGLIHASIRTGEHRVEYHDYDMDKWLEYCILETDRYPIIQVHSLQLVYGEDENAIVLWDIPLDMVQKGGANSLMGVLRILPQTGSYLGSGGVNPLLFGGMLNAHHAPSLFRIEYDYGLDGLPGDPDRKSLPAEIVRAIGLQAAIHPLNILGDLVIGAGVASYSISMDGISRSVNTTASAENAAFSARILQHHKELRGDINVQGLIPALQAKWRRTSIALL